MNCENVEFRSGTHAGDTSPSRPRALVFLLVVVGFRFAVGEIPFGKAENTDRIREFTFCGRIPCESWRNLATLPQA